MKRSKRSNAARLDLLVYFQHGCLVLAINRPESNNSWSATLSDKIAAKLRGAETDASITAAVITATGHDAFSVGQTAKSDDMFMERLIHCYDAIRSFSKPIVAAVNGDAIGIGFYVTQLCDYVVTQGNARLGHAIADGQSPSVFGTRLMWERVGRRAVELALNGRLLDADEAKKLGVIHEIADAEAVLHQSVQAAQRLSGQPRLAYPAIEKGDVRAESGALHRCLTKGCNCPE